jgi:hypothetical protein
MTNNNSNPYSLHRQWIEEDEREHDDYMDAIAYDRRAAERDGWKTDTWDGR